MIKKKKTLNKVIIEGTQHTEAINDKPTVNIILSVKS